MGIRGIDNLKGDNTMEDQNVGQGPADSEESTGSDGAGQKDTSAAAPVDAAPDSAQPATPASEEAEAASGQSDDDAERVDGGSEPSDGGSPDPDTPSE